MVIVQVDPDYCKGCLLCQSVCPSDGFRLSDHPNASGILPVMFDPTVSCRQCMGCVLMCPDSAIEIYEEPDAATESAPAQAQQPASVLSE